MTGPVNPVRSARGRAAHGGGLDAEAIAAAALESQGWTILGRRLRTPAGEIDIVAIHDGLVVFAEVKRRATLYDAAGALRMPQQARLFAAAAIALDENPDWRLNIVRFDVFIVDRAGVVRRIMDALRQE